MKQLEGFSSSEGEHLLCKLNKSIYGLKQAFHQRYLKFHEVIAKSMFCNNSTTVFMAKNNKSGSRSKHIDIKYLVIRERVKENKVVI